MTLYTKKEFAKMCLMSTSDYTGYLSPTLPVIVCPGDSGNGLTPRTGNHLTQGYR